MCFDSFYFEDYGKRAPCMFLYRPALAAKLAASRPGVFGSRAGNTQKNTGFGALLTPIELMAHMVEFTPDPELESIELGERAEIVVRRLYEKRGWAVRPATKEEQIRDKFDFEVTLNGHSYKIEVKSRGPDKAFPKLFVQTHERNDDKRIK